MGNLYVEDTDRIHCGYLKSLTSFESEVENHTKYRKGLLLLSVFSIIYNLAGIKLTGTSVGLISGSISTPSVLVFALIVALIYHQVLYILFVLNKYERYLLDILKKDIRRGFYTFLAKNLIRTKVTSHLHSKKHLGVLRVTVWDTNFTYDNQEFEIYCNHSPNEHSKKKEIIEHLKTLGYDVKFKDKETRVVETHSDSEIIKLIWYYKASKDDEVFLGKYLKHIRLNNLTVFIEYRVPLYLSLIALSTFSLKSDYIMDKLHILNNYLF
ncbi:hypothetical protein [Pseudoalteromonas sp. bablab_jr010]|uniref:hypothetical protein n=1 Tax=Pseudoalteromonas sp. bablab_jr010 TaxID=2755063 RepID=UPI0018F64257|nr:hypothetical protein [Pseudoalteromonas sp. bablab_jr010]